MFNAGVLVFQNYSHVRIQHSWRALLLRFLRRALPFPSNDSRMLEQWSLAMAIAYDHLSYAELGADAHAFAWLDDDRSRCIVLHYGNHLWRPSPINPDLLRH
jgi:hypothetical protein